MDYTQILIKVRKIVRSINLESKKIQREYGVSIPQVLCLSYLQHSVNYQSSQGDIAKYLNLNQSTVNGIIKRLEEKGFVARLPKYGDKRVVHIALTSVGDDLLRKTPVLLHDRIARRLTQLSSEQLKAVESSLDQIIELLGIEDIEASPMITTDIKLE